MAYIQEDVKRRHQLHSDYQGDFNEDDDYEKEKKMRRTFVFPFTRFSIKGIVLWIIGLAGISFLVKLIVYSQKVNHCKRDNMRRLEDIHSERIEHLQSMCEKHGLYDSNNNVNRVELAELLVNNEHKLIIRPVQQIGSSFWKSILVILDGIYTDKSPFDIKNTATASSYSFVRLTDYPTEEANRMLREYTTVMFTRDPLSRIYSAYQDLFASINMRYWKTFGANIINLVREDAHERSKKCGHDVTFEEFIKYITDVRFEPYNEDAHWSPVVQQTHPCQIHYDVIGKVETFIDDIHYVLCKIGASNKVDIPEDSKERLYMAIEKTLRSQVGEDLEVHKCIPKKFIIDKLLKSIVDKGYVPAMPLINHAWSRGSIARLLKNVLYRVDDEVVKNSMERKLKEAYEGIPPYLLDKLKFVYEHDFELFGY
ncbi:unnamed protein product [Owenia fusiformis]|uniref:Carbohydrate sulfotransferase n=1 Tax=Owenia fusiformis TaxID=6347 RepID=A0A8J1XGJ5_OWEFU|nr:unnamed protein product [Owenia fusiformis]